MEKAYENAIADGDEAMTKKYKAVLEQMEDDVASATSDFQSAWEEALTEWREAFENDIDRIADKLGDAFAGNAGTFAQLKDNLDYAQKAADRYLPEYKEIYELSKLNRDINNSINDTDNIKGK